MTDNSSEKVTEQQSTANSLQTWVTDSRTAARNNVSLSNEMGSHGQETFYGPLLF
jgi:hypothetical protein